MFFLAGLG